MRDAEVLILDEPTAALDARAEYEVFQRFRELSAGRSAVLADRLYRGATGLTADRYFDQAGIRNTLSALAEAEAAVVGGGFGGSSFDRATYGAAESTAAKAARLVQEECDRLYGPTNADPFTRALRGS